MNPFFFITEEEIKNCSGAFPGSGFCLGSGFSREEFKDVLLEKGAQLSEWSVFGVGDLCLKILNQKKNKKFTLLQDFQAEFVLETILSEEKVQKHFPKTVLLLGHKNIYKKLVESFFVSRMSYAHEEEKRVLIEKMQLEDHQSELRAELVVLCQVFEEWILDKNLIDMPLLLSLTKDTLEENGLEGVSLFLPQKIIFLEAQVKESRELAFLEVLSKFIEVQRRELWQGREDGLSVKDKLKVYQAHTLSDAAEYFLEELKKTTNDFSDFSNTMVLIPDEPEIRRTLVQVFEENNIPLVEDRDPTFVRLSEEIKTLLLPMELKTSQFSYEKVSAYLVQNIKNISTRKKIMDLFFDYGWNEGVGFLQEQASTEFPEEIGPLLDIHKKWRWKLSLSELKKQFFQSIEKRKTDVLVLKVFEKVFQALEDAIVVSENMETKYSLSFWLEKIKTLLHVFPPLVAPSRPEQGLCIYRMNQMSLQWLLSESIQKNLFIFTLPKGYLSEPELKSLFWTDWEREVLSAEFHVRGPRTLKKERSLILKTWMAHSQNVILYDAQFSAEGAERPSPLTEISFLDSQVSDLEPVYLGVASRWEESFHFHSDRFSSNVLLPSEKEELKISASLLDEYSRCPYRALVRQKWKLEDLRNPQFDLYPEVQGQILHRCAEIIIRDQVLEKEKLPFVIETAFSECVLKGTIKKVFLLKALQKKLIPVLELFLIEEHTYQKRSGAKIFELESKEALVFHGKNGTIVGRADRVDIFEDGLFVMDYKTSSDLPSARQMMEHQYRLQLPFYSVALTKKTSMEVYGSQFISLTRGGGRGRGIFFKKYNGKEEGFLTNLRGNSHSLVDQDPRELWLDFEEVLEGVLSDIKKGIYHAQPKFEEECATCFAFHLCGKSRGFEKVKWEF